MNRTQQRGYIEILGLIIVAALIGYLFWRLELAPTKPSSVPPGTADLLQGSTPIEQDLHAVQAAQNAKAQIENNYTQQQKAASY